MKNFNIRGGSSAIPSGRKPHSNTSGHAPHRESRRRRRVSAVEMRNLHAAKGALQSLTIFSRPIDLVIVETMVGKAKHLAPIAVECVSMHWDLLATTRHTSAFRKRGLRQIIAEAIAVLDVVLEEGETR